MKDLTPAASLEPQPPGANTIWRTLVRLTVIAGIIFAFYRLRSVITTLFVAAIIAYAVDPLVETLTGAKWFVKAHQNLSNFVSSISMFDRKGGGQAERKKPRLTNHALRLYATLYALVISVLVLWFGASLVIRPFVSEFQHASAINPATNKSNLQSAWERGLNRYDSNPSVPPAFHSNKLLSTLRSAEMVDRVKVAVSGVIPEGLKRVAEGLMSIVEIVLLPVLAFYFLIDGRKLKHEFVSLVPRNRLVETVRISNEFNRIMRAFIKGQFILCLLAGLVVGVGLAMLHVGFPITLGILAGVTRAIPIIGPIVGGIPIVLLTLADKGPAVAAGVLGFFTFLHFAESKFIMPILIGDRMELHPVIVIVVLLVGGEAGGLIIGGPLGSLLGMFFAAPVAALIKIIIRRYWLKLPNRTVGKAKA